MKNVKIEIKWAIYFVLMTLSWMALERITGLSSTHIDKHAIYTNFIAIPAIAVYVLALLDKRKNFYNGVMTYKQGFVSGIIITLLVTLFSPLTQIFTSVVIVPEYFPNIIKHTVENGSMTQAEAESYFSLKSYIMQGLAGAPIMGFMTTALVALFTRSKTQ
jgi:hypothetical protein